MPRMVPVQPEAEREYWNPRFPDFARENGAPLPPGGETSREAPGAEWTDAPAGSHVHSFRFIDARDREGEGRFARRFGDLDAGYGKGGSLLLVRFKSPSGGVGSEYRYEFAKAEAGLDVFSELVAADHPGEVVHARLVAGRVPYRRIA